MAMYLRKLFFTMILLFILLFPYIPSVEAHAFSAGYTTLNLSKERTDLIFSLDELSVIELTDSDINKNGMVDEDEFQAVKEKLEQILKENLLLKIEGERKDWIEIDRFDVVREGDASKVVLKATYPAVSVFQSISFIDNLYRNDPKTNYVNLLTINYGKQKSTAALSGENRTWLMLLTEDEWASMGQDHAEATADEDLLAADSTQRGTDSSAGWFSFFKLGMNHILTGYDHLLFLFSLLLARQTFKQYAIVITSFTIAHCLTLTLTVLGILAISPRIVEPAIALSICYVAIDNIFRKKASHRWMLTFLFGLIHGMGFADLLKEMDLPKHELVRDLFSFNLGIEVVQLSIVIVLLPLLLVLHRWKFSRQAVIVGSSIAVTLGGVWLIERIFFT
jgi:hydrogenase/urease accessory protein HupE